MGGAFIDRIRENPGDNTAMLVYADWREERGEAEAAAVMREAARSMPDSPLRRGVLWALVNGKMPERYINGTEVYWNWHHECAIGNPVSRLV